MKMVRKNIVQQDANVNVTCEMEAPEGGWGWVAALGMALMFTVVIAPFSVFGLLFEDMLESLGEGTQAVTLIISLTSSVSFLLGVVINYSLTKYSCRQVGVVGSIIFFAGSFTSAFATSMFLLTFAYGILQGIGVGLIVPAALTSFNLYFVRRRTFAMGIAQVITGIGSMIVPIILQKFIEIYGFRGTQAIISAIGLHSLLCAVVQQPVEIHMPRKKPVTIHLQECDSQGNESDLETGVVKGKCETTFENTEGIRHNSSLKRDENISYENIKGNILIGGAKASNADAKSEFQTIGSIYQNPPLIHENQTENINEGISTGNLNEIVVKSSEANKQSQIILVGHDRTQMEFDKDDEQEDDSAEQCLIKDDYLKVSYTANRTSTDLATSTTEKTVSISDSRATVTSLRSWTSSCERRGHAKSKTFYFKSADNTGAPNFCSRLWSAVVHFLDLHLLLDPVYVNIVFGMSASFFADVTFCTLFPLVFLKLGYSRVDSALCISILSAADIFGRLSVALIGAFCPHITSRALLFAGAVTSVIGRIIFVSFKDFVTMATLIGYLGFTRSFIHVPMPLVFAEYNAKKFPAAYGLGMVMAGIFGILAGPLVGWIRDVTNSYPICINVLNIIQLAFCIFPWSLEFAIYRLRSLSRTKEIS